MFQFTISYHCLFPLVQCIGATTIDEYRRYIEKDGALKRRFLHVDVPEPSVDEAVEILKGIQGKYEAHHDVKYADEALVAAVRLSNQYIRSKFTFTYLVTYQIISDSILCFQLIPFSTLWNLFKCYSCLVRS